MFEQMGIQMCQIVPRCHTGVTRRAESSTDRRIRDFLLGKTDGEDVLHELYDHVLDEPVPERMRALFRR